MTPKLQMLWDELEKFLRDENQRLQQFNNLEHQPRKAGAGSLIFNRSPKTQLVLGWSHYDYNHSQTTYNLCLQIGSATKNALTNYEATLKSIMSLPSISHFEKVERFESVTHVYDAGKAVSIIAKSEGSNFYWIGIKHS